MANTHMLDTRISVIKVRDMLMVTMPPDPDDATISLLQEKTLAAMERHEAKSLVLDISAVETLDSFFARTVSETAKMVALMGGRTIRFGEMETALNVDRALEMTAAGKPSKRHE
jgi:rsbT antagonist protein RsbS